MTNLHIYAFRSSDGVSKDKINHFCDSTSKLWKAATQLNGEDWTRMKLCWHCQWQCCCVDNDNAFSMTWVKQEWDQRQLSLWCCWSWEWWWWHRWLHGYGYDMDFDKCSYGRKDLPHSIAVVTRVCGVYAKEGISLSRSIITFLQSTLHYPSSNPPNYSGNILEKNLWSCSRLCFDFSSIFERRLRHKFIVYEIFRFHIYWSCYPPSKLDIWLESWKFRLRLSILFISESSLEYNKIFWSTFLNCLYY